MTLLIDAGALDGSKPDTILQYDAGAFTPLLVAGRPGPVGIWPNGETLSAALIWLNCSGSSKWKK